MSEEKKVPWERVQQILAELIDYQQKVVLATGRKIVPMLTTDDVLQPNDFPELEGHPYFRYEEGMLAGLNSAAMALAAARSEEID